MSDARDAALIDALLERGVLQHEAEGLLQRTDDRLKREVLKARVVPPELTERADVISWCLGNGGHVDAGGMFFFTCATCKYEDWHD